MYIIERNLLKIEREKRKTSSNGDRQVDWNDYSYPIIEKWNKVSKLYNFY